LSKRRSTWPPRNWVEGVKKLIGQLKGTKFVGKKAGSKAKKNAKKNCWVGKREKKRKRIKFHEDAVT